MLNKHFVFLLYFFFSKIIFSCIELIKGRKIKKKIKSLNYFYKLNQIEKEKKIYEDLKKLVFSAFEKNQFYNYFYKHKNLDVYKLEKDIKYFLDFPEIDKNDIIEYKHKIVDLSQGQKYFSNKTGGSTGPSVRVFYDSFANDFSSAVTIFCRSNHIKFGQSQLHFASNIHGTEKLSLQDKLKSIVFLRFHVIFDFFEEKTILKILKKIQYIRPYLVHCHPSVLYQLASYIDENKLYKKFNITFRYFESSGETISIFMKKKIQKVFNCQIINRYGLAEFGIVAYQLDTSKDELDVISSNFVINKGFKLDNSQSSNEIIVTSLKNFFMPLIKYKTGDYAEISYQDDMYSCVKLNNISGRVHDYITVSGKKIFTHTIQDFVDHKIGNVRIFQIDTRNENLVINFVPENKEFIGETEHRFRIYLPDFKTRIVSDKEIVRKGFRNKFRHII